MRKLIPILFLSMMLILGTAFSASAIPIYLDVTGYGEITFDPDQLTGTFAQMGFFANTTTTQFGNPALGPVPIVGDTFSDTGNFNVDAFKGLIGDTEGLGGAGSTGTAYSITGSWSGLTGSVTGSVFVPGPNLLIQTTAYNPGTIIDLYIDADVDQSFGGSVAAGDDTGFGNDANTMLIGQIKITGGTGINTFNAAGGFVCGSSVIDGDFIAMADNFWYTAAGLDIYDDYFMKLGWTVTADVDQNTDNVVFTSVMAGNTLFTVDSDHDGSIDFGVIPEPATMLLLGSGLLGLAGIGRKKKFFKKD